MNAEESDMSRRPNVIGILIISALYWGALGYWQYDTLIGGSEAAQMKAFTCG